MKITHIHATPLALAFKEPYHWAGRVDYGAATVLIEVETNAGLTGIGESTSGFPAEATVQQLRGVAPLFVGESPFDIERLLARARPLASFNDTPWHANLVLAGLEMALWDIIGQAANRPVYQLLGGAYRSCVNYFGFLQGDTTEELVEDARQLAAQNYDVIYFKVGRGEALDLENTAAVRAAIGDRRLRLDANSAWDTRTAIYLINRLARFNPEWIEQPTPHRSLAALKQVKDAVSVPLAADQSVFTLWDVYDLCRERAADAIVISIHEAGGLLALKKAAAVAEAAGIPICLHGQSVSGITDLAQHHVGLTIPNLTDGNQIMHQLLIEDLIVSPDLTPQAGNLGLPDRPGLGFEIDRDAVARAAERYRTDERYHHA